MIENERTLIGTITLRLFTPYQPKAESLKLSQNCIVRRTALNLEEMLEGRLPLSWEYEIQTEAQDVG